MQEQELFQQYELKGWQLSPHLYKIIGASAIINIVAFFLMAQANFLTGKTCDSPLASGVCSVVDALYMGAVIGTTDVDYIDDNYIKTELEDADITFVEYSEPFKYPEGYFALANPNDQAEIIDPTMIPPTDMNGFPNVNPTVPGGNNDLMTTTPIKPTPNNKAVIGTPPISAYRDSSTTVTKNNKKNNQKNNALRNDSPGELPPDGTVADKNQTKQDEKPLETIIEEGVKINRQVLKDYGNLVKARVDKKEVDLNQPFTVVVEGALTKDGKLDTTIDKKTNERKSKFTVAEGDPQMVEVAKEALEAVGDSGWLGYLTIFDVKKVKITLVQDNDNVFATVEADQPTAEKAKTMASKLGLLMSGAKLTISGEDEKILLSGAQQPTANGKVFILNFLLPKQKVREMIDRNLKKAAEANQNSTAQTENTEQKTSK